MWTALEKIEKNSLKQQINEFRSENHYVFTKDINQIPLSVNDDKKNTINRFNRSQCIWGKQRCNR